MKKFIYIILCTAASAFISCEKNHKDPVIPEDAYPQIMGQWPSGDPGNYSATVGGTLEIELQFTPSETAKGTWYIDGEEYATGTKFSFSPEEAGVYELFLEVKTPHHSTSRSANITVEL